MARLVKCKKLGKELPGLDEPPFPGAEGEDIFANVSKEAWDSWQALQVMLINEKRLTTFRKEDKKWLAEQRQLFFDNKDHAVPSGYKPIDSE